MAINKAYVSGVGSYSWDIARNKMAPKIANVTTYYPDDQGFPEPYVEGEICFRRINSSSVQCFCVIKDGIGDYYWMPVYIPDSIGARNASTGQVWSSTPGLPFTNQIRL